MQNQDHLVRILSNDGTLRAMAVVTTELVRDICQRHQTDPVATIALGRLTTGTALMGALLKGQERLGLMIEANGPLQKLQAETDADGVLRASIRQPLSGPPPEDGSSPIAAAVGKAGFLHVIKDLGLKEPYRSMVQLQTSEIGEDIAYYLTTSEQVPSAVSLGVLLSPEGTVTTAGGFLIQALPNCPEERLIELEQALTGLPPVSQLLAAGETPEQILNRVLVNIEHHEVSRYDLRFECGCNVKRVVDMLRGLPEDEQKELAERDGTTTITCEYCRKAYSFTADELSGLSS